MKTILTDTRGINRCVGIKMTPTHTKNACHEKAVMTDMVIHRAFQVRDCLGIIITYCNFMHINMHSKYVWKKIINMLTSLELTIRVLLQRKCMDIYK